MNERVILDIVLLVKLNCLADELLVGKLIVESIIHLDISVLPLVKHVSVLVEVSAVDFGVVTRLCETCRGVVSGIQMMTMRTMVLSVLMMVLLHGCARIEHHECS